MKLQRIVVDKFNEIVMQDKEGKTKPKLSFTDYLKTIPFIASPVVGDIIIHDYFNGEIEEGVSSKLGARSREFLFYLAKYSFITKGLYELHRFLR